MSASKIFASALLATFALAGDQTNDSYLQTFKNLNNQSKDDFILEEKFTDQLGENIYDDLKDGLGQYGQYNENGVRRILDKSRN